MKTRVLLALLFAGACGLIFLFVSAWAGGVSAQAELLFGQSAPTLGRIESWRLAWSLTHNVESLTLPRNNNGSGISFTIEPGEPVSNIISRLNQAGLLRSASAFRDYLVYSGADTRLVPGIYELTPAMTALEIAANIQNIEASGVLFRILPGWRLEEVAAALPSAGIQIFPEEFISLASQPPEGGIAAIMPRARSHEGLLMPERYNVPRNISGDALLDILTENFRTKLTKEMLTSFSDNGLTLHEAVTLASIIQREAVIVEEMPLIASVFLNRLAINMKLEADPTVQYSIGYTVENGWWKAPLSLEDLKVQNPYNTYQIQGLPPGPIANPGFDALSAVAFPEKSGYYYFRAACDGSGRHLFAITFEQHLANGCP